MKSICTLALLAVLVVGFSGCASGAAKNNTHERGWIGGKFQVARRGHAGDRDDSDQARIVPAFPEQLRQQQRAGIFVSAVYTNTALALAGIREGDLILRVNQKPVERMRAFRNIIDRSTPGTALPVVVFRDGQLEDHNLTVGRETFQNYGYFSLGIHLPTEFDLDLWPDPDFSLVALGYSHNERRLELHSPQQEFIRRTQAEKQKEKTENAGVTSDEGWCSWLAIFSCGGGKTILTQEIVESRRIAQERR